MDSKKILYEAFIAFAIAILASGALMHFVPQTLDAQAYSQALRLNEGKPIGNHEILSRAAYAFIAPLFGWQGASGMVSFFLVFPVVLLALCAMLSYALLRLSGFDNLEGAAASVLIMLSAPIAFSMFPGIMPMQALSTLFCLIGLLGITEAAREKVTSYPALALSIIGFGAAIWAYPIFAIIPLAFLAGQIMQSHSSLGEISKWEFSKQARMAALIIPLFALGLVSLPAISISPEGIMKFLYASRFAIGIASVSIPALWAQGKHPQAPFFATLFGAALLVASSSHSAGIILLLLPAAYGLRTLGTMADHDKSVHIAMAMFAIVLTCAGMFAMEGDIVKFIGATVLLSLAASVVVHLYDWAAPLSKMGIAVFLLSATLIFAVQATPKTMGYEYSPITPEAQDALIWLGKNHPGANVAIFAPADAVSLLSGAKLAANSTQYADWLSSSVSANAPFASGDYIVIDSYSFDDTLSEASSQWTLVHFVCTGKFNDQNSGNTYASCISSRGYGVYQPIDADGFVTSSGAIVFSTITGQQVGQLIPGDTGSLYPNQSVLSNTNLLLWYGKEYKANMLSLFRGNPRFVEVYGKGGMKVFEVVS